MISATKTLSTMSELSIPQTVAHYGNIRVVCLPELKGIPYGIRYNKEDVVYVSPAVFSLLKSDEEQDRVLQHFKVKVLQRKQWPGLKKSFRRNKPKHNGS